MKGFKLYITLILLLIVGLILVKSRKPQQINWERTFQNSATIPFGTEVLFTHLKELFPEQKIIESREPIYNLIQGLPSKSPRTALLHISSSVYENPYLIDSNDVVALLSYVANGNIAFLSSNEFPKKILDTLHLDIQENSLLMPSIDINGKYGLYKLDTLTINLTNRTFAPIWYYRLEKETGENVFKPQKNCKALLLGVNKHHQPNFVKVAFGKGFFYLHTVPEIFTNFYLLKYPSNPYANKALSYLNELPAKSTLYWEEYTKQGRRGEASLLRYVKSVSALNWAYMLALLGVILYIIVEGKRKQRIIPIVLPPQNDSLEFVKTVGQLYFQQGNHLNLAFKKIHHFKHFVLKNYYLHFENTPYFVEAFSHKANRSISEINRLVSLIEETESKAKLSERELIELSNLIESFYT